MEIITRILSIGPAGANVLVGLEYVTNTNLSGGGDTVIDPTWTQAEIEAAIAEGAREALRATGVIVEVGAPTTILGGVSKV